VEGVHEKTDEENKWDHRISAGVKGPAVCIRIDEVTVALKKTKSHKAPALSGLVAEMIQATGDIETQWIGLFDLCNCNVKECCIPENWKSSMVTTKLQRER